MTVNNFQVTPVIPLFIFLSVFLSVMSVYVAHNRNPLHESISRLMRPKSLNEWLERMGAVAVERYPLVRRHFSEKEMEARLKNAGYPFNLRAMEYLALKLVAMGAAVLILTISLAAGKLAMLVLSVVWFLPDAGLWLLIRRRNRLINKEFVIFSDKLSAAVCAGKNIPDALIWIKEKGKKTPLRQELEWCLDYYGMGIPLEKSFDEMASRTGLVSVRRLATALINAQKYGAGIANVLAAAASDARKRRMDEVDSQIETVRSLVQLSLVAMVLPGIILILAPMLISYQGANLM